MKIFPQLALLTVFCLFFPRSTAAERSYRAAPAFPALTFENPLYVAAPPDGTNRLFVVEQDGRVLWFENDPAAKETRVALDIRKKVRRVHNEEGFLGLAFHPGFKTNGFVFLQYSASDPRRNVISRFKADAVRESIDPASETMILEMDQPYGNHNGGMLAFGPDGYLYIGLGDGGAAGDPHDNGQRKDTLLGKILRIDVDRRDGARSYAVPKDNPFVNQPGARGEIWAWGLRNPWRFSFDRKTGDLWAGDVGQDAWEEIDIVKKGLNYGWNRREGKHPFRPRQQADPLGHSGLARSEAPQGGGRPGRDKSPFEEPVTEHGREDAQSITGGYVYRGRNFPELDGAYIYGDFMTGKIWALRHDGRKLTERREIAASGLISSFGEDEAGEIYFTSFDGKIYTLRPVEPR